MVLRLKARESRSPPGLARIRKKQPHSLLSPPASAFLSSDTAGWSSPVARQAHNLKVRDSNPLPATKIAYGPPSKGRAFSFAGVAGPAVTGEEPHSKPRVLTPSNNLFGQERAGVAAERKPIPSAMSRRALLGTGLSVA